jgi:UDP-2,3-diacylglucosamine pyrophosphatase LpxH
MSEPNVNPKADAAPDSNLHTVILSDLHLTDFELGERGKSLWKRYKRPKFAIDQSFRNLMTYLENEIITKNREAGTPQKLELVLNGDIFDFDSITRLPLHPHYPVSWLEKQRGLYPEEEKSRFKMDVILGDHLVWVQALRNFIRDGHQVVFVIGNHDVELHWPMVQKELVKVLAMENAEHEKQIRFCEWFYISNQDTVIEHGNQYDDYCVTANPIHPLIKKGRHIRVRLPFGNITSRYMVNGLGLFNPHVESSFIMSAREYFGFFYKYALRVQPLLPFTWLWSTVVSFWVAVSDGILPAMRDPLYIDQRVDEIALKANATAAQVRTLRELQVHPAVFNPLKIARELWLDRVLILILITFVSFEIFAVINIAIPISWAWFVLLFLLLFPYLLYYSRDIKSEIIESMEEAFRQAPTIAQVAKVKRVIFGHTHRELHTFVGDVEVLNTGTWSAAFKDPECKESFGRKCFAWISPSDHGRIAKLFVWNEKSLEQVPVKK